MTYRIAQVSNGVVERVIVAEALGQFEGIDVTGTLVSAGWLYDGETFSVPPPEPTPTPPLWKAYDYAGFIDALTTDEAIAFVQAKASQPRLEVWVELARARGVNFNDEATRAAAPLLISLNILTSARLNELAGGTL